MARQALLTKSGEDGPGLGVVERVDGKAVDAIFLREKWREFKAGHPVDARQFIEHLSQFGYVEVITDDVEEVELE